MFDNMGRKLSSKINTYKHLIIPYDLFRKNVDVLKDKWILSKDEYTSLIRGFVYSTRLNALRSLCLNKEMKYLPVETAFWQSTEYEGTSKKDRLILNLLKSYIPLKGTWLYIFFLAIKLRNSMEMGKLIYKDLESRSAKL